MSDIGSRVRDIDKAEDVTDFPKNDSVVQKKRLYCRQMNQQGD